MPKNESYRPKKHNFVTISINGFCTNHLFFNEASTIQVFTKTCPNIGNFVIIGDREKLK